MTKIYTDDEWLEYFRKSLFMAGDTLVIRALVMAHGTLLAETLPMPTPLLERQVNRREILSAAARLGGKMAGWGQER